SESAAAAHERATPDQRADAAQHSSKLVHHGLGLRGGHRHRAIFAPVGISPVAPPPLLFTLGEDLDLYSDLSGDHFDRHEAKPNDCGTLGVAQGVRCRSVRSVPPCFLAGGFLATASTR